MIDALVSGKLIKDTELRTGQSGKPYCQFMLSVAIGDTDNIVVSCMSFGDIAERVAKLGKGDAISVTGSLKPTSWPDKGTGEIKHGLSVTVSSVLSAYDIKKKRRPIEDVAAKPYEKPAYYDDVIPF